VHPRRGVDDAELAVAPALRAAAGAQSSKSRRCPRANTMALIDDDPPSTFPRGQ
jgi:hypothetical protein